MTDNYASVWDNLPSENKNTFDSAGAIANLAYISQLQKMVEDGKISEKFAKLQLAVNGLA